MPLVRIKSGVKHRVESDRELKAGAVFLASDAELAAFGDKFDLVTEQPEDLAGAGLELEDASSPQLESPPESIDATDAARELAAEYDLDLSAVEGSGSGGRVIVADVRKALSGRPD